MTDCQKYGTQTKAYGKFQKQLKIQHEVSKRKK